MDFISKMASASRVETVKVVSNEHLNANNTLFGGYLMCWIDEIAFMCACRYVGRKTCVTVGIDNVTFKASQKLGDHVYLLAQVVYVGHSSMEIEVHVHTESMGSNQRVQTNIAALTFVLLDEKLKPCLVPRLILDTLESQKRHRETELRIKVKKRLSGFIEKNLNRGPNIGATVSHQKSIWPRSFHIASRVHHGLVMFFERQGVRLPIAPRFF